MSALACYQPLSRCVALGVSVTHCSSLVCYERGWLYSVEVLSWRKKFSLLKTKGSSHISFANTQPLPLLKVYRSQVPSGAEWFFCSCYHLHNGTIVQVTHCFPYQIELLGVRAPLLFMVLSTPSGMVFCIAQLTQWNLYQLNFTADVPSPERMAGILVPFLERMAGIFVMSCWYSYTKFILKMNWLLTAEVSNGDLSYAMYDAAS